MKLSIVQKAHANYSTFIITYTYMSSLEFSLELAANGLLCKTKKSLASALL